MSSLVTTTTQGNTSKLIEAAIPCPHCPSSDAYHRYSDGHGYCFSCSTYDPPLGGRKDLDLSYTYEYLPYRNLLKDTLKFYDIKTKIDQDGKPISIGYRMPNGDYKVRSLDALGNTTKEFWWQKDPNNIKKVGLFGRDKFARGSHKYVTITEGYEDAASLYQVLGSPVVSVHSASSAGSDCTADHSWLNSFERVYIAFDNDAPGRDATAAVARLFDYNKVFVVRLDPRKDANEWLAVPEGHDELKNIWWNSKRYLPENIVSSTADFKRILEEPVKWGIPYPFATLTEKTYGIRRGESVLITAQEGVGKTELMHAIEYQLLRETSHDTGIGAIFLEEPKRRHLQALAGLVLKRPVHLPDCDVEPHIVAKALEDLLGVDDRLYLYSHFGSDDAGVLLDTIRFLVSGCNCPFVLLDHITMAVSGLSGEDERRSLDYLATRLEMMVKELDFGLIIVSHVNDIGQTRGSRYISKIADIRIDATRDLVNSDPVIRNTTSLTVSKNRFSGRTGPAGTLLFDPVTYTLQEIGREGETPNINYFTQNAAPKVDQGWVETDQGPSDGAIYALPFTADAPSVITEILQEAEERTSSEGASAWPTASPPWEERQEEKA